MARVYVSIGSNIDRRKNISQCLQALQAHYGDLILSTTWENSAVGFKGTAFFNLVAGLETNELPEQLAKRFRLIETQQGRDRSSKRFSSRTLDIDLLLYDQKIINADGLQIPRHEITRYAFVLKPLAEIYPEGVHPVLGTTYADMWELLEKNGRGGKESKEDSMIPVEEFPARF